MNRLFLFLCLLAISIACEAQHIVYRMDRRPPADIFARGFVPPGRDNNLYLHVIGETCYDASRTSGFVATTSDQNFARDWGSETVAPGQHFYIYRMRPTARFVPTTISLMRAHDMTQNPVYRMAANTFVEQREWASHGPIPANSIIDAHEYISRGPLIAPERVTLHRNARFVQAQSTMRADPYVWDYADDDPDAPARSDATCASCFGGTILFGKHGADPLARHTIANVLACRRRVNDQMSALMNLFDDTPIVEEKWREKE